MVILLIFRSLLTFHLILQRELVHVGFLLFRFNNLRGRLR
jgi:hypothetical protein